MTSLGAWVDHDELEIVRAKVRQRWRAKARGLPADLVNDCIARVLMVMSETPNIRNVEAYAHGVAERVIKEMCRSQKAEWQKARDAPPPDPKHGISRFGARALNDIDPTTPFGATEAEQWIVWDLRDLEYSDDDEAYNRVSRIAADAFYKRVRRVYLAHFLQRFRGRGPGQAMLTPDLRERWGEVTRAYGGALTNAVIATWTNPVHLDLAPMPDGSPRLLSLEELTWVYLVCGARPLQPIARHGARRYHEGFGGVGLGEIGTTPEDAYRAAYQAIKKAAGRANQREK